MDDDHGGGPGGAGAERVAGLLAVARRVLGRGGLGADDVLTEHGASSLSLARILAEASVGLALDIDLRDVDGPLTVRALAGAARAPEES